MARPKNIGRGDPSGEKMLKRTERGLKNIDESYSLSDQNILGPISGELIHGNSGFDIKKNTATGRFEVSYLSQDIGFFEIADEKDLGEYLLTLAELTKDLHGLTAQEAAARARARLGIGIELDVHKTAVEEGLDGTTVYKSTRSTLREEKRTIQQATQDLDAKNDLNERILVRYAELLGEQGEQLMLAYGTTKLTMNGIMMDAILQEMDALVIAYDGKDLTPLEREQLIAALRNKMIEILATVRLDIEQTRGTGFLRKKDPHIDKNEWNKLIRNLGLDGRDDPEINRAVKKVEDTRQAYSEFNRRGQRKRAANRLKRRHGDDILARTGAGVAPPSTPGASDGTDTGPEEGTTTPRRGATPGPAVRPSGQSSSEDVTGGRAGRIENPNSATFDHKSMIQLNDYSKMTPQQLIHGSDLGGQNFEGISYMSGWMDTIDREGNFLDDNASRAIRFQVLKTVFSGDPSGETILKILGTDESGAPNIQEGYNQLMKSVYHDLLGEHAYRDFSSDVSSYAASIVDAIGSNEGNRDGGLIRTGYSHIANTMDGVDLTTEDTIYVYYMGELMSDIFGTEVSTSGFANFVKSFENSQSQSSIASEAKTIFGVKVDEFSQDSMTKIGWRAYAGGIESATSSALAPLVENGTITREQEIRYTRRVGQIRNGIENLSDIFAYGSLAVAGVHTLIGGFKGIFGGGGGENFDKAMSYIGFERKPATDTQPAGWGLASGVSFISAKAVKEIAKFADSPEKWISNVGDRIEGALSIMDDEIRSNRAIRNAIESGVTLNKVGMKSMLEKTLFTIPGNQLMQYINKGQKSGMVHSVEINRKTFDSVMTDWFPEYSKLDTGTQQLYRSRVERLLEEAMRSQSISYEDLQAYSNSSETIQDIRSGEAARRAVERAQEQRINAVMETLPASAGLSNAQQEALRTQLEGLTEEQLEKKAEVFTFVGSQYEKINDASGLDTWITASIDTVTYPTYPDGTQFIERLETKDASVPNGEEASEFLERSLQVITIAAYDETPTLIQNYARTLKAVYGAQFTQNSDTTVGDQRVRDQITPPLANYFFDATTTGGETVGASTGGGWGSVNLAQNPSAYVQPSATPGGGLVLGTTWDLI